MRTSGISYSHLAFILFFFVSTTLELVGAQNFNPIPSLVSDESTGPETGGGGNIVLANGQLTLLDFFNFSDTSQISLLIEKRQSSFLASSFLFSGIQHATDKARILNSSPANFIRLSEVLLHQWGLSSEINSNPINPQIFAPPQLQRISWSYVLRLETDTTYFNPPFLPASYQIEKAAYYTAAETEVKISRVIWSHLDFSNRLGLIVHEKFRQIQLTFGYMMDDQLLQKMTVMAMICKPEPARLNRILIPRSQQWGQFKNLRLYTEQLREANMQIDHYLNECLTAAGLNTPP